MNEQEEQEKIIICFDATELDNFDLCPFRWMMIHHRNIQPKTTPGHFELGSLVHYFLERYYLQKRDREENQVDLEEVIEEGRIQSLEYSMNLEEVAQTIFQFREYVRYYKDESIVPVFIEEPFMVKIFEDECIEVYISGKPDLIFHYSNSPNLCVMDHKRMTKNTAYSPMRNQFLLYTTALNTDTMIVNKVGFQKTLAPKDRFVRTPFIYSDELKNEWKEETIQIAKEMIFAQKNGSYARRRTSCEKWSGCFLQRYCCTRPKAREFLIGTEYLIGKTWDVTKNL